LAVEGEENNKETKCGKKIFLGEGKIKRIGAIKARKIVTAKI
jgi:hypothetical protein